MGISIHVSACTVMNTHCVITSWSFKSISKDDLARVSVTVCATGKDKLENTYDEVGNLVVYRLLLRDLFFHVNYSRSNNPSLTHLIEAHRLPKSLNESCHLLGIFTLIYEPSPKALRQQCLRLFLDLF